MSKNPPRETVILANEFFRLKQNVETLYAVDLGCGSGRDTKFLLEKNWHVLAIDREKIGIELLKKDLQTKHNNSLSTKVSSFEELELPEKFDLINSSYALPFCKPDYFPNLWLKIKEGLKIGGKFSGQLFGIKDEWVKYTDMNFHTKENIHDLFEDFTFDHFNEVEKKGPTSQGVDKHWHVFHIVATKVH